MQKEEIYKKFEELDKVAALGGGVVRIDKQHEAGRMTARERIDMLLDKGTFVELDKFVTHRCTNFGMEKTRFRETVSFLDMVRSKVVRSLSTPTILQLTEERSVRPMPPRS